MRAPEFWYARHGREAAPLTRALLTPLSWLYGSIAKWRFHRAQSVKLDIPVICVGNISVGGTGKTPLAMKIAALLIGMGHQPAFLTRGYQRTAKGNVQVDVQAHSAADVGDEALLLARIAPTFVGADRVRSAKMAMADGADCLIMDDGLQNPQLAKDFSILVVDARRGIGNGRLLPAGPLRERLTDAIQRCQAVFVTGDGMPFELAELGVRRARLRPVGPPPQGRLFAFAGIGDPQRFFDALRSAGGEVVQEWPFPDHHAFTRKELTQLQDWAGAEDAQLITTEKDHVRLPASMREQVQAWPVRVKMKPEAENWLKRQLAGLFS